MEQGARAADAAFAGFAHRHAGGCCGGAAGQMQGEPAEHDSGHALLDEAHVPRPGSPSDTLALFAQAGDDLAKRRGTCTTTDWSALSVEELASLADCGCCARATMYVGVYRGVWL